MNSGERNELLVKLKLVELRDTSRTICLNGRAIEIQNVSFNSREFRSLPQGTDIQSLDDRQIVCLANSIGASKAGRYDKADVFINGEGYSIKSLATAPPALVNHTNRLGWERVCNAIGQTIDKLDLIINDYWERRESGTIGEDVLNDRNSPFYDHKDYLLPILNYFLFTGTGSRDSNAPANYILDIEDPLDTATWSLHGQEFLDQKWDNLVFSIRAKKGMPANYPNINADELASIKKWTKYFQGEYRGALHVRFNNGR